MQKDPIKFDFSDIVEENPSEKSGFDFSDIVEPSPQKKNSVGSPSQGGLQGSQDGITVPSGGIKVPSEPLFGLGGVERLKEGEWAPTVLKPEEEQQFRNFMTNDPNVVAWAEEFKNNYGEVPDLEAGGYDYRGAWKAGQTPIPVETENGVEYHWGSIGEMGKDLKSPDHPTRWKSDYMQTFGKDPDQEGVSEPVGKFMVGLKSGMKRVMSKVDNEAKEIASGEIIINGSPVSNNTAKKNAYDREFIKGLLEGRNSIEFNNADPYIESIYRSQIEAGGEYDEWKSLKAGLLTAEAGLRNMPVWMNDVLEEATGIDNILFTTVGSISPEARKMAASGEMRNRLKLSAEKVLKAAEAERESKFKIDDPSKGSEAQRDVIDLFNQGKYGEVGRYMLNTTIESGPVMLTSAGAALATGNPIAGAAFLVPMSASMNYAETGMDDSAYRKLAEEKGITDREAAENFIQSTRIAKANVSGLAEGIPEALMGKVITNSFKVFSGGVKQVVGEMAEKVGPEAAKRVAEETAKTTATEIVKNFAGATALGGLEEFTTTITNELTDVFLGTSNKTFPKIMRTAFNDWIVGMGSTGIIVGPGAGTALSAKGLQATKKLFDNAVTIDPSFMQDISEHIETQVEAGRMSKSQAAAIEENLSKREKAVKAVPEDKVSDTETVDTVQEIQELEERKKGLLPVYQEPIQAEIDAKTEKLKEGVKKDDLKEKNRKEKIRKEAKEEIAKILDDDSLTEQQKEEIVNLIVSAAKVQISIKDSDLTLPSARFQMPSIQIELRDPFKKRLIELGYSDADISKMTIEQQQDIIENKREAPEVVSSAKVDSVKESERQSRIAEMQRSLDEPEASTSGTSTEMERRGTPVEEPAPSEVTPTETVEQAEEVAPVSGAIDDSVPVNRKNIAAKEDGTPITLFHGGKKILSQKDITDGLMYFSDDKEFSEAYSEERHGQDSPKITEATITIENPAPSNEIEEVAKSLGLEVNAYSTAALLEEDGVMDELIKRGYDGALANDFGFRSDFEEVPVYAVFNAKKQVKISTPTDAVQEQSTESVPVRQQPEARQGVREEDTQGQETPQEGEAVREEVVSEQTPAPKRKLNLGARLSNIAQKVQEEGVEGSLLKKTAMWNRMGKRMRRSPFGANLMSEMQQERKKYGYELRPGKTGRMTVVNPQGKEVRWKSDFMTKEEKARRAAERKDAKKYKASILKAEPISVEHYIAQALASGTRFNRAQLENLLGKDYDIPSWMRSEKGMSIQPDYIASLMRDAGYGMDQESEVDPKDIEEAIVFFAERNGRKKAFEYAEEIYNSPEDARQSMTEEEVREMQEYMEKNKEFFPDSTMAYDGISEIDQLTEEQAQALEDDILAQDNYESSTKFIQDAERYAAETEAGVGQTETKNDVPRDDRQGEAERKAIAKRLRDKKIGGVSFVDPLFGAIGISKTIYDGALELAAKQVEKGTKIGTAIANAIKYIDERMAGKKWDKGLFGRHLNDQFKMMVNGKEVEVKRDLSEETLEVVNGWYSPLEKTIKDTKADSLTAKEWLDRVRSKEGEDMWTGLRGMLEAKNPKDRVSKRELLNYLKDNRVDVVEVVKDSEPGTPNKVTEEGEFDYSDQTKFSSYQLEGEKTNYKEVLVTLPKTVRNWEKEYEIAKDKIESLVSLLSDARAIEDYLKRKSYYNLSGLSSAETNTKKVAEAAIKKIEYQGDGAAVTEFEEAIKNRNNKDERPDFRSSHFDEPNILVHLRMNTRKDADGNKVLFLEEVQSDWGQKGKREGFITPEDAAQNETFERDREEWNKLRAEISDEVSRLKEDEQHQKVLKELRSYGIYTWIGVKEFGENSVVYTKSEGVPRSKSELIEKSDLPDGFKKASTKIKEGAKVLESLREKKKAIEDKYGKSYDGYGETSLNMPESYRNVATIPSAPFVTDTNSWVKLGVKVALKEAVAQGVDRIAWTTGEQQNERYDLSKQVNEIKVEAVEEVDGVYFVDIELSSGKTENIEVENGVIREGSYKGQSLEDVIGKEYAEKVLSTPRGETKRLRGADLRLGGKGMKGFYGSPKEGSKGILGSVMEAVTGQETGRTILRDDLKKAEGPFPFKEDLAKIFIENAGTILVGDEKVLIERYSDLVDYIKNNGAPQSMYFGGPATSTQPSISITPELRSAVEKGQPLFGTSNVELAKAIRDKKITGTLFVDPLFGGVALTKAVYNGALELAAKLVEQNTEAGKVIAAVMKYVDDAMKGTKFNRNAVEEGFKKRLWFVADNDLFNDLKEVAREYGQSLNGKTPSATGLFNYIKEQDDTFTASNRHVSDDVFKAVFGTAKPEKPAAPVAKPSEKATKEAVKEARGIGEAVKKLSDDVQEAAKEMTSTEGRKETDDKFNEAHDEAFEFAEKELSGIMNALVPEDKKGVYQKEKRNRKESLERGKAMIQSGAINPSAFISAILKSPRPLSSDEIAAMVYYKTMLDNRVRSLSEQSNKARENGDVEGVSVSELALDEVDAQIDEYYQFQEATGYEQGHSLGMRQLLLGSEYEIANQVRKYKKATGKSFVPPDVMAKFKMYDEAIKELSKRIDEFEKKSEEASESLEILSEPDPDKPKTKSDAAKLFANKVRQKKFVKSAKQLASLQSDPTGLFKFAWDGALEFIATTVEQGGTIADAVDGAIDKLKNSEWYKNLSQKGKDAFENTAKTSLSEEAMEYAGISIPTLTDGFLHIPDSFVKDLIKNGFDTIETATIEARRFLLENLGIEATERQVRDAISDYGKRSKLSKDEVSQKMREMKRVGKLLSALEDVQRKKRPLRSGRERDAMTQKEREIKREINALLKDIPQTSEETDAAWKSALDATKTRLRNRIEDIQKQIAEGKKTPKKKSIELDAEAKYLKEEVDRLNEILRSIEGKPEMTFEQRVRITEQAIERSIQEYERRIREKDFEPMSKEPVSTPEIEALRTKREQLRKQYSEEYSKSPAKDTARDSAAMKRLQKQIDELTEKIHGRISIESKKEAAKEYGAHVKAMQNRVKSLREALMETEQGKAIAEKRALENVKKAATRSIQEYERRIREKDFAVKKSKQVALDAEAKALKAEQQKWKNRFDTEREKSRLDERTKIEKLREGLVDVVGIPKSLQASLDFSSILRQGGMLTARHPKMAVSATKEMIKQTFNEAAYEKWMDEFIVSDIYNDAKKAGLYVSMPNAKLLAKEESFVSNLAEMIPIYGRLIKASNRAYSSYLNVMRIAVFADFQNQINKSGLSEKDAELAKKDMATFINNATGRGSLLGYEPNSPELNLFFFSPKFVLSRANIVMNTATGYAAYHPKVRKEALLTVATYLSAVTTLILLSTMAGADAEDDPRSSDFGKIRIGKLRLDPLAGLSQMVVFFSRLFTGKQKTLTTGEIEEIKPGKTIKSFARSKASPSATFIIDMLDWRDEKVNRSIIEKNKTWGVPGVMEFENKLYFKNIVGEEQTLPERAISLMTPIYTQGALKIYQEEGLLMAAAATGSDIIGIGSQYHSTAGTESAEATLSKSEKELEKEMSGFKEKMAEKLYEKKGDNFLLEKDQNNIGVSKATYGDYTVNDYKKLFKDRYSQITAKDLPNIDKSGIRESHNATVLRNKNPKLSEHILSKDGEGVSVKNPVQVASSMHGAGIKELTDEQKALLRKFYGANGKSSEVKKIESELKKLQSK